jgi:MFS-type transporter involved in bile tolerance (Atg22 family)
VVKYLTAFVFFEAGNSNLINASTTLITQQLKISDPSGILGFILIVTIPGAAMAPKMKQWLGIKRAVMSVIGINVLGTLSIIFFVNAPSRASGVWFTGLLYGIGLGMTYPLQRSLYM